MRSNTEKYFIDVLLFSLIKEKGLKMNSELVNGESTQRDRPKADYGR